MDADDPSDGVVEQETRDPIWPIVVRMLRGVAPFVDVEEINRFEPLEDELALASSDLERIVAAISEQTGTVVPEEDRQRLTTLDGLRRYFEARVVADS